MIQFIKLYSLSLFVFLSIIVFVFAQGNVSESSINAAAMSSLEKSQSIIDYMDNLGLNTERVYDLLDDAKLSFDSKDYERVVELHSDIRIMKETAVQLTKDIEEVKSLIEVAADIGFNSIDIEENLNEGIEDFEINNYELASKKIVESLDELKDILSGQIDDLIRLVDELKNVTESEGIKLSVLDEIKEDVEEKIDSENYAETYAMKMQVLMLNSTVIGLIQAKLDVNEMDSMGLGIIRVNDLLKEANLAIELRNFNDAGGLLNDISKLKDKSIFISKKIEETRGLMNEANSKGMDTTKAESLLTQSINKFEINDYEESETILNDAVRELDDLMSSSLLFGVINKSELKFNIVNFFKLWWWFILIVGIALSLFGSLTYKSISVKIMENKISRLKKEQESLINLIKKSQTEYFKKKTMGKDSYDNLIDRYQERILKIKEILPLIESKLKQKTEIDKKL